MLHPSCLCGGRTVQCRPVIHVPAPYFMSHSKLMVVFTPWKLTSAVTWGFLRQGAGRRTVPAQGRRTPLTHAAGRPLRRKTSLATTRNRHGRPPTQWDSRSLDTYELFWRRHSEAPRALAALLQAPLCCWWPGTFYLTTFTERHGLTKPASRPSRSQSKTTLYETAISRYSSL